MLLIGLGLFDSDWALLQILDELHFGGMVLFN